MVATLGMLVGLLAAFGASPAAAASDPGWTPGINPGASKLIYSWSRPTVARVARGIPA